MKRSSAAAVIAGGLITVGAAVFGPLTATAASGSAIASSTIFPGSVVTVEPNTSRATYATCGAGRTLVGGGFSSSTTRLVVFESKPLSNTVWRVQAGNEATGSRTLQAFVVCM